MATPRSQDNQKPSACDWNLLLRLRGSERIAFAHLGRLLGGCQPVGGNGNPSKIGKPFTTC